MNPIVTEKIRCDILVIGSGAADLEKENGLGTQIVLGRGATEPLILGQVLKNLLDTHFNDLKDHVANLKDHVGTYFDAHVHPTGVGPSGPPTVLATAIDTELDAFDSALDTSIEDLVTTLSKYGKTK